MARARRPSTRPRKAPVQARSAKLVADILEAAVRVLEREGPHRFTTLRVAAKAGVSVGSLYQYFPNKESILYRLQVDEWKKTGEVLEAILVDPERPPAERLRAMVRAFFVSECEEASLRRALEAASVGHHDDAESRAHRGRGRATLAEFVRVAAPHATARQRAFATELVMTTISAVGKGVSERGLEAKEVLRWADATTGMLLGHLDGLSRGASRRRGARASRTETSR